MIEQLPSFLVAFPFLPRWEALSIRYERWVLDSGAWSVWNAGGSVDLTAYIAACRKALERESPPDQIFALDVVGDWETSLQNTQRMWAEGIEAVPTYHSGEPWDVLKRLRETYPRIAVGGVGKSANYVKMRFANEIFARAWPAVIHGFAYCSKQYVEAFPFASVDSTSWFLQPVRYKRYKGFDGGAWMPDTKIKSLRGEIDYFIELQTKMRHRWKKQMTQIDVEGPTLYLSHPGIDIPTGFEMETSDAANK